MGQSIACVAKVGCGGRCRNIALEGGMLCAQHDVMPSVEAVGPADRVVVKFYNLPAEAIALLKDGGMPSVSIPHKKVVNRTWSALAEKAGRSPHAIREERADAGSQVFGRDGVRATIDKALHELGGRYDTTSVVLQGNILIVTFGHGTDVDINPDMVGLIKLIAQMSLRVHVWANPPEAGVVTDTVNVRPDPEDETPLYALRLGDGLWAIEEVGAEQSVQVA